MSIKMWGKTKFYNGFPYLCQHVNIAKRTLNHIKRGKIIKKKTDVLSELERFEAYLFDAIVESRKIRRLLERYRGPGTW